MLNIGNIISALITFLITAAVVFFVFVKPMNALTKRLTTAESAKPEPKTADTVLLEEIRDLLRAQQGN